MKFPNDLFLSVQWTDSHHETNTRFSEMYEMPDVVDFLIYINHSQDTDLRIAELKGQTLPMM